MLPSDKYEDWAPKEMDLQEEKKEDKYLLQKTLAIKSLGKEWAEG